MWSSGYGTCVTRNEVARLDQFPNLDLSGDLVELAAALIDIPSVSKGEAVIADRVELALTNCEHLEVLRSGNTVLARTNLDRAERIVIGGHLDTVPEHDNLPHAIEGGNLFGLGACDMKGGVAVALKLAAELVEPIHDLTYLFYECEEIESRFNGLALLAESHPEWLAANFAILMEPSNAGVEAGCQGTLRVEVATAGTRAHSARSWMGVNAIHKVGQILNRLNEYSPRVVEIDGLEYREGLNAVAISGGVAGNVIPDAASVTINYRYAPSRLADEAVTHVREVFDGFEVRVVDNAPGALPGLHDPAAAQFIAAVGSGPTPKFGWTDVSRFSELGVPAVNFGPGDPSLAHTQGEFVPISQLMSTHAVLVGWLSGS